MPRKPWDFDDEIQDMWRWTYWLDKISEHFPHIFLAFLVFFGFFTLAGA